MPRPRSILVHLRPAQRAAFFTPAIEAEMAKLTDQFHLWTEPEVSAEVLAAKLAETEAEVLVCGWATPRLPEPLPAALKYVLYVSGSVKTLVSRDHLEQGAVVTNWGNSISRIVAEAALMHVFNTLRATAHWTLRMHVEKGWDEDAPPAGSLFGRNVGIYGFGFIARELVKLLRPFGVEIMTHAPGMPDDVLREFGVARAMDLNDLFAANSVVVNLAPLTAETRDSIGLEQLRLLDVGEVLVSVGRGPVINEDALLTVAAEGQVQFALDVFHQEPLPADSPLRGLTNVMLTPHRAGPTDDRMVDAGEFALANLRAYVNDEPLRAVVTPEIYDAAT
ncbi:NAD(P)-dependent oxidoreductase [Synoicihabitans lomoniglobus]|uniref:NAD(P)-dependent oxidoreductase n=1 Tax=Synoicihabitans lomoniglobus TaxID=2909285 RepID=A0AAF0CS14_9BACT|nr:hydroxyacid dehydrogenase [Opitutaceae bacterium LMO-M01]WED66985.1 NAD(P)-dependent oxidoreductase [Opitutaceae bacterium LMO-M01]